MFYKNFASIYFKTIDRKYSPRLESEKIKQSIDVTNYWILADFLQSPRVILISGNVLLKHFVCMCNQFISVQNIFHLKFCRN